MTPPSVLGGDGYTPEQIALLKSIPLKAVHDCPSCRCQPPAPPPTPERLDEIKQAGSGEGGLSGW